MSSDDLMWLRLSSCLRPYLSLMEELHSGPLFSTSPSILVPTTLGNRSSASTEYCRLLPSRRCSRATGHSRDGGNCHPDIPSFLQLNAAVQTGGAPELGDPVHCSLTQSTVNPHHGRQPHIGTEDKDSGYTRLKGTHGSVVQLNLLTLEHEEGGGQMGSEPEKRPLPRHLHHFKHALIGAAHELLVCSDSDLGILLGGSDFPKRLYERLYLRKFATGAL
ncbi:hypothetical protein EYF80_019961 [Liparis tanakae]|uniref:Uncharacterized protein n=1 Tax=Liparis tanakae TaxID=230148 RepID=A0A4Z2HY33_9TELE|nr:hypothetical protein EYF80_019961 [Liparis tanakae]